VTYTEHDLANGPPAALHGDVVCLIGVLEHLDHPVSFLQSLRTVAPTLIVEVPDVEANPLNWARRRLPGCPWYSDADHVREYSRDSLLEHLARANWTADLIVQKGGMVLAACRR
jgi:hypothetical protein